LAAVFFRLMKVLWIFNSMFSAGIVAIFIISNLTGDISNDLNDIFSASIILF